MAHKVTIKQQVEVEYLQVDAKVWYWENAIVNGAPDTENGDNIPCKEGDSWKPLISLDTGRISNWYQGTKAEIHYNVCDYGVYTLLDSNQKEVCKIEGYVPEIMCPIEDSDGDHICMNIDADGVIEGWEVILDEFDQSE